MDIKAIASGSSGNAYLVSHGNSMLLIDAGIGIKDIAVACSHRLSNLDGVLISHAHKDHCRAVKDLLRLGIDCYMSDETVTELNCNSHRTHRIAPLRQQKIGAWVILPFSLVHDSGGPLGFLVAIGGKKLMYACDTAYIRYRFNGLTHIMVECNYSMDILNEKIRSGETPEFMRHRLIWNHMSLGTVKNFLMANDLHKVEEIWLVHLSDRNADGLRFRDEVQRLAGKIVKMG